MVELARIRPRFALILLTSAVVLLPASASVVQDPFAKYAPTTLAARFTAEAEAVGTRADLVFSGAGVPSRARVEFLGKSRPLSASKRDFCEKAFQTLGFDKKLNEVLSDEWQFRENGREYWLTVQKQVAEYFPKELTPGDEIDVYFVGLGGVKEGGAMQLVFLVNEFQSVE